MDYKRRKQDLINAINRLNNISNNNSGDINSKLEALRNNIGDAIACNPNYDFSYELFNERKKDRGQNDGKINDARYYLEAELRVVEQKIREEERKAKEAEAAKQAAAQQKSYSSTSTSSFTSNIGEKLLDSTSSLIKSTFNFTRKI